VWAGLLIAATAWGVATPLGGSPDEPAHIIKAASVARGEFIGQSTDEPAVRRVMVPEGIATASEWACYAFDTTEPASCLREVSDGTDLKSATTSAGLYNPVFYLLVGWPSLLTGDTSVAVIAMRTAGALVVTFFLAAGFTALRKLWPNRATAFGFAAAVTPMVLFLASAVNPNALEVATGFALLSSLLLVLGPEPLARRWPWLALAVASGVLLAQARGLSPLWMATIAIVALVATPWPRVLREVRRPAVVVTIAVLAAAVGAALGWTLLTGSLGSMGTFPGTDDGPKRAFATMLLRAFDPGLIGYFGWLDTPAPAFVFALWSFLAFAIVIVAAAVARARGIWALVIAAGVLLVTPAIVQALSVQSSGYIWQGRYALVAYATLIVVATTLVGADLAGHTRPVLHGAHRFAVWVAVLVVIGHVWALFGTLQRYQGGIPIDEVLLNPTWSPPGGLFLWLAIVAIGATITAVAVLVGTTRTVTDAPQPTDRPSEVPYASLRSEKGL
jgi:hypothetical protein